MDKVPAEGILFVSDFDLKYCVVLLQRPLGGTKVLAESPASGNEVKNGLDRTRGKCAGKIVWFL